MKTIIKSSHIEISEALREYLEKRLQNVEKFLDENAMIEAELGRTTAHHKSGDVFRAELNVMVHGELLRAVSEGADLYVAIDDARDELHDMLASRKDKRQTLWKRGSQKIKNLLRMNSNEE